MFSVVRIHGLTNAELLFKSEWVLQPGVLKIIFFAATCLDRILSDFSCLIYRWRLRSRLWKMLPTTSPTLSASAQSVDTTMVLYSSRKGLLISSQRLGISLLWGYHCKLEFLGIFFFIVASIVESYHTHRNSLKIHAISRICCSLPEDWHKNVGCFVADFVGLSHQLISIWLVSF